MKMYSEAEAILKEGIKKTWRSYSYIEDPNCWSSAYYIWLTVALYYQEKYKEALAYAAVAIKKNEFDELAKTNYQLCLDKIMESCP